MVEPHAKRHRRLHAATLERLDRLQQGTEEEVLLEGLEAHGSQHLRTLAQQVNMSVAEARAHLQAMVERGEVMALGGDLASVDTVLLPASLWAKVAERVRASLQTYHRQFPLRRGAPREEVRGRLGLSDQVSVLALQRLIREGVVVEEETVLWVPEHRVSLSRAQRQTLDDYVKLLGSEPYSPPTAEPPEPDLLQLLVDEGKVVKVSDEVVFTAEAYQQMVDRIVEHLKREGKITVAQVRDMFNTSRKYALALMEHMDQQRVTRRVGDERVLR